MDLSDDDPSSCVGTEIVLPVFKTALDFLSLESTVLIMLREFNLELSQKHFQKEI